MSLLFNGAHFDKLDERELRRPELSEQGRRIALSLYPETIREATEALLDLAAAIDADSPYHNMSLRVRMCQAARDELAALVAEWEAIQRGED